MYKVAILILIAYIVGGIYIWEVPFYFCYLFPSNAIVFWMFVIVWKYSYCLHINFQLPWTRMESVDLRVPSPEQTAWGCWQHTSLRSTDGVDQPVPGSSESLLDRGLTSHSSTSLVQETLTFSLQTHPCAMNWRQYMRKIIHQNPYLLVEQIPGRRTFMYQRQTE